jgi:hypothetical protein
MMMMMILFIYLFLFQILFVSTNELIESNDTSTLKQIRNRATVPQSLTLLMNFKDDGTTSFQIMQGNSI